MTNQEPAVYERKKKGFMIVQRINLLQICIYYRIK